MRIKSFLLSLVVIVGASALYMHFRRGAAFTSDELENPVYKAWAACKTGSTVTYKITDSKSQAISTRTLIEVLPSMAVFSNHTTSGAQTTDETCVAFARVQPKHLGLPTSEEFMLAIIDSSTPSPATIQVKGGDVAATLHTFDTHIFSEDNRSTYKTWTSEAFPGGVVKLESKAMQWELVEFAKSESDVPRPAQDLDDSTPKGLLRMLDRQGLEKGREFIASLYDSPTPAAKSYADAQASFEFALLTLEKAARTRYGEATSVTEAIDMLARHHQSRAYIETGTVVAEAAKAALVYDLDHSVRMVAIDGHWRFPAFDGDANPSSDEISAGLASLKMFTGVLEQFTSELNAGKYKSERAFRNAVTEKQEKIAPENL